MKIAIKTCIIIQIICIYSCTTINPNTLIDYPKSFENVESCKGNLQSPINLIYTSSLYKDTVNFLSDDYKTITGKLSLGDNGSVYKLKAPQGTNFGSAILNNQGYYTKNVLTQIQVNYPSEHQLFGENGDLEVKLIHERIISYKSDVNQNKKFFDPNVFFTISILFKKGEYETDNGFIDSLFNGWSTALPNTAFISTNSLNIDMNNFNLVRGQKFFFYPGSSTEMPCDENVNYIVINKFYKLNDNIASFLEQQFKLRYLGGNANKQLANTSGRPIYRNFITPEEANKGFYLVSVMSLLLFSLFFWDIN
jgi:carbonic anhydrase